MVFCEYRPDDIKKGYDRVGIFARDNGQHAADTKNMLEIGESYCMTYDSDDGYLRAGNIINGGVDDFRPKPRFHLTESGWHRFSIRCKGNEISYELDGKPFHTEKDKSLRAGECGVYYKSGFTDLQNSHGIRFSDFQVVQ
jgi:hypothetical protein